MEYKALTYSYYFGVFVLLSQCLYAALVIFVAFIIGLESYHL